VRHYGFTEDYERNERTKLHHMEVWSGAFMSDFEGWADELPKRNGYMITLDWMRGKVRVACPSPRNDDNWREVDEAINKAMNDYYESKEAGK
jgi:hypothetical protein